MIEPLVRAGLTVWLAANPWAFAVAPPVWVGLFMSPMLGSATGGAAGHGRRGA